MITKIKKIIFKIFLNNNLTRLNEKTLNKLYDLYDYNYLDDELKEINKELQRHKKNIEVRTRFVNDMIHNNINEFIFHFGDFKTADMWINEPWKLGKYEKLC